MILASVAYVNYVRLSVTEEIRRKAGRLGKALIYKRNRFSGIDPVYCVRSVFKWEESLSDARFPGQHRLAGVK